MLSKSFLGGSFLYFYDSISFISFFRHSNFRDIPRGVWKQCQLDQTLSRRRETVPGHCPFQISSCTAVNLFYKEGVSLNGCFLRGKWIWLKSLKPLFLQVKLLYDLTDRLWQGKFVRSKKHMVVIAWYVSNFAYIWMLILMFIKSCRSKWTSKRSTLSGRSCPRKFGKNS